MVTVAPAIAAPVVSSTVPETDPYSWLKIGRVESRQNTASAVHASRRLFRLENSFDRCRRDVVRFALNISECCHETSVKTMRQNDAPSLLSSGRRNRVRSTSYWCQALGS